MACHINRDNNQPMRRLARYTQLPPDSHPLIEAFVEKRLLIKDTRGAQTVVEVALESLLRQWRELAAWLRADSGDLKDADTLERAAADWRASGRNPAWLLEDTRLNDAETLAAKPGFRDRLNPDHRGRRLGSLPERLAREHGEDIVTTQPGPTPVPGWYRDPRGQAQRYFDGTDWTEDRSTPPAAYQPEQVSTKSFAAAGLLQLFFGWFGLGRFYVGSPIIGVIQLVLGLIGIFTTFLLVGSSSSAR